MKKEQKALGKQLLMQLGAVLLLVALLLVILITESTRAASIVLRERVRFDSFTYTEAHSGYLFRDETALRSNNNGPVHYLVGEAECVTAGTTVAEVYLDDTGADKREQAERLSQQIQQCDAALAACETAWQYDYVNSYAALMQALSAGNADAGTPAAKKLAEALSRRDAQSDEVRTALLAQREQLQSEWDALVAFVDAPQTVPATKDGIFYRQADGFEALFGTLAARELTPEGLDTLLAAPTKADDVIGKLVSTGSWCFAIPTDAANAATYRVGTPYTVHFDQNQVQATLQLTAVTYSEDGERAILLLEGDAMPKDLAPTRRQSVTVEKETVTGLAIPASALTEGNTVYVDDNGVARAHTVTPVLVQNGCVLLPTDGTLQVGDRVLISARRVYDGKVLN